ncbi:MAG: hypothetical protein H8E66_34660 [Planctomycetes bacterium]|nr:hypothetical protein [Planctomycetota bacterium]
MQHRYVAVRQQDRMTDRPVGMLSASKDVPDNGLEMAATQKRVWFESGESINNVG